MYRQGEFPIVQPVAPAAAGAEASASSYAKYTLGLLAAVYVVSTLDRSMLTIVADDMKRDLHIADAQVGFLYGTAFSVFYVVFGIPMGKLADRWSRSKLLTICLLAWTAMTVLSGLARSFGQLLTARIGVGIGEASVGPCACSLLADTFPRRQRAVSLAIYSCGATVGTGLAAMLGGFVLHTWAAHGAAGATLWGLKGWQAAMLAAAVPGLILSVLLGALREPVRGNRDGLVEQAVPVSPVRLFLGTLAAIVPGLSLFVLATGGAQARRALLMNAGLAAAIVTVCGLCLWLTGDIAQWIILSLGTYVTFTWVQTQYNNDQVFSVVFFQSSTIRWLLIGYGLLSFCALSFHSWWVTFFTRYYGADNPNLRSSLGLIFMVFGTAGMILGGILGDSWRKRSARGYLYVGSMSGWLTAPLLAGAFYAPDIHFALVCVSGAIFAFTLWLASALAGVQELVLPRMRGLSSALYLLVTNFLGTAVGPYTVGKISDASGGNLRLGMVICCCGGAVLGAVSLLVASRHVERERLSLIQRARTAGEPV